MAKKFACDDVVNGCGWSETANDETEMLKKIVEHAKKDHNMSDISDVTIQKVRSKVRDV
ncbi:MAG: DUF1059 domain-containing protein [Candidatus Nitrosotenuis sp.]